jgi:hypothetical protein
LLTQIPAPRHLQREKKMLLALDRAQKELKMVQKQHALASIQEQV